MGDRCQPWRHPRPHPGLRPRRASSRTRAALSSDCRRHGRDIPAGRPSCPRTSPQPRSDLRLVAPLPRPDGRPTLGHRLHTPIRGDTASATPAAIGYADLLNACPSCRSTSATLVDRSLRLPAMLTLTYPGDWLTVAPDGETVKRHFTALAKRYERTWGEPLVCIWKLEFQDRGRRTSTSRPHRRWVSQTISVSASRCGRGDRFVPIADRRSWSGGCCAVSPGRIGAG